VPRRDRDLVRPAPRPARVARARGGMPALRRERWRISRSGSARRHGRRS
jgi:hypothetical protein